MIGGTDISIPTKAGQVALDVCLRSIRSYWQDAVFVDARSAIRAAYEQLKFDGLNEIFVYRDLSAAESWENEGADPSNVNSMIHVLWSPGSVTLVVDDQHEAGMRPIIATVTASLHMDILHTVTQRERQAA